MTKTQSYSVGELRNPQPGDMRFQSQIDAEQYARKESLPDIALAVWDDETGEVVAIAYDGLVYWP